MEDGGGIGQGGGARGVVGSHLKYVTREKVLFKRRVQKRSGPKLAFGKYLCHSLMKALARSVLMN